MDIRWTLWRRLGVFGAIVLVASLGDLRGPISSAAPLAPARIVHDDSPHVETAPRIAALHSIRTDGNASATAEAADEARLVPAIYAWDPDVRFVYYRHVSKWM